MCEVVRNILAQGRTEGRAEGRAEGKLELIIGMVYDNVITLTDGASRLGISNHELSEAGRMVFPDFPILN